MAEKKEALLIFSKPPIPGLVKTRMTQEYGGIFTQEQAAEFFRRCLFDVCEMSIYALMELQAENDAAVAADPNADKITYDFVLSTTPASSVELMKQEFEAVGPWPMEVKFLTDMGHTFDDHFDDAFKQLFDMGYESVVSIGADVPVMPKNHVKQAFQWLEYFQSLGKPGFVEAPCQECGTSLVGFSYNTPINNQGIYYNLDGRAALDGYVEKLQASDIPSAYFAPVADVDEITDLAHAVSCMRAIEMAAQYQDLFVPRRTLAWVNWMGIKISTPPNDEHDPRQYLDGEDPENVAVANAMKKLQEEGMSDDLGEISDEERRRIAEGMKGVDAARAKENQYEASKYN